MWGSISSKTEKQTPIHLKELTEFQLKNVCCGKDIIFAIYGNQNTENIQFSSLNPPIVKAGNLEGKTIFIFYCFFFFTFFFQGW